MDTKEETELTNKINELTDKFYSVNKKNKRLLFYNYK